MPMAFTGCQYRSAIWYEADQEAVVSEACANAGTVGKFVHTQCIDDTAFYRAEEYHQNYVNKATANRGF